MIWSVYTVQCTIVLPVASTSSYLMIWSVYTVQCTIVLPVA